MTLTDSRNSSRVFAANLATLSPYAAEFPVAADVRPGVYTASLSNGYQSSGLQFFVSAAEPLRTTVVIKRPRPSPSSRPSVQISSFGPTGVNITADRQTAVQIDSSAAVAQALNSAADCAASHGTECDVMLPVGRTYVQGQLLLGDRVVLRGQSTTTSSLYFAQHNGSGWENLKEAACPESWCGAPPSLISHAETNGTVRAAKFYRCCVRIVASR